MDVLRIFSPATVANVSCGFDAMAFALETLGDEMVFRKNDSGKVTISKIEGATLPFDPTKNAAGEVARLMLANSNASLGVDIEIYKKYKPGSGLGSSAASSAGAAFAMNLLLGNPCSETELVSYAMKGEEVACGSQIADNVAAAIYGGFVLIRSYVPLDLVSIPTPEELYATVIHPQIEVKTADARAVLPKDIPLKTGIRQWANVGGLISGLHSGDYELIGRSLVDEVAEPVRKPFIPHFDALKKETIKSGALGVGISGSGPSVFALSRGKDQAEKVAQTMKNIYKDTGVAYQVYVSRISKNGVRILDK
ncbi:MAG: homoserine kinase [Bacteroidota bacterium]